jgi:hypothetical protein
VWLLISVSPIVQEGKFLGSFGMATDITERKQAEARILRLNRLYVTISQINQTIVHAGNKDDLFREICGVATEHGKFRMAWVGLINKTDGHVIPIALAGEELDLESKDPYRDETLGRGPTGTAIREDGASFARISPPITHGPWRKLHKGYCSSASVPIREQGQVVGALAVYAGEPYGFDTEDEGLLEQIGLDVSFALDSIYADADRKRAQEDLVEAYDTTIEGWAKALELRDKETEGHSRRVTDTTLVVARIMGISEEELIEVYRGSILHDIGKMGFLTKSCEKMGRSHKRNVSL